MPEPKPSTAAPRLKLVIRRLPPTIPEAIFWQSVSPWIDEGKSTWRKWYPGKKADEYVFISRRDGKTADHRLVRSTSSSVRQQRVFSRAYVMMADFEKLQAFAGAFDGHVFRGKDGEPPYDRRCVRR
jgi:regulator of nonsense transcripts 3